MHRSLKTRSVAIAAAAAAVLIGAGSSSAAVYTWSSTAAGNWSDGTKWSGGVAPVSASDTTLNFNAANATYTATNNIGTTLASPFVLNRMVFGTTGTPTISGGFLAFAGASPTIDRASGGGTPSIASTIVLNAGVDLSVNAGASFAQVTFASTGKVTGAGSLTSNSGILVVGSATSDFSGGINVNGGEVVVNADSTGAASAPTAGPLGTGTLTLSSGKIRTNNGSARTMLNNVNIAGDVGLGATGSGNNLTFAGATTLSGTGTARALTLAGAKTFTFTGAIGDAGAGKGVNVVGDGVLKYGSGATDTVANTYTGLTTLNGATASLILDKASGTTAIAGNLSLQAGTFTSNQANQIVDTANVAISGATATFAASETVNDVTVSGGSFKSNVGANVSVNSLAITGGTNNTHGGALTIGAGGLNVTRPAAGATIFDALAMNNGGAGTLKLAGDVTVNASTNANAARIKQGGVGGNLDLNGGLRTFSIGDGAAAEDLVSTLVLTDSVGGGGIRKTGAGTMALTVAADPLAGGSSVIEAGRLVLYNHDDDPTLGGSAIGGNLSVQSGGTLGGNGRMAGAVTIAGLVDPSIPSANNLGGTYSANPTLVLGAATFASGGTLRIDGIGSTAADKLIVLGLLDLSSSADSIELLGSVDGVSEYLLGHAATITGAFDSVNVSGLTGSTANYTLLARPAVGGGYDLVLAVPEPGIAMTVLGFAGLLGLRRRPK